MPTSTASTLKTLGASILTSMAALDVFAESSSAVMQSLPADSDTKKLLIAGLTSIITQVLLKLIENAKRKRSIKPEPETIKEG